MSVRIYLTDAPTNVVQWQFGLMWLSFAEGDTTLWSDWVPATSPISLPVPALGDYPGYFNMVGIQFLSPSKSGRSLDNVFLTDGEDYDYSYANDTLTARATAPTDGDVLVDSKSFTIPYTETPPPNGDGEGEEKKTPWGWIAVGAVAVLALTPAKKEPPKEARHKRSR